MAGLCGEVKRSGFKSQCVGKIILLEPAACSQAARLPFHFLYRWRRVSQCGLIKCLSCISSAMNFFSITITFALCCLCASQQKCSVLAKATQPNSRKYIYIQSEILCST